MWPCRSPLISNVVVSRFQPSLTLVLLTFFNPPLLEGLDEGELVYMYSSKLGYTDIVLNNIIPKDSKPNHINLNDTYPLPITQTTTEKVRSALLH